MTGNAAEGSSVSDRVRAKAAALYGPVAAERVVRRLEHLDLPGRQRQDERLLAAILLGAGWHPAGVEGMAQLAETDWRDALVAGGLANEGWKEWLDSWLTADDASVIAGTDPPPRPPEL